MCAVGKDASRAASGDVVFCASAPHCPPCPAICRVCAEMKQAHYVVDEERARRAHADVCARIGRSGKGTGMVSHAL